LLPYWPPGPVPVPVNPPWQITWGGHIGMDHNPNFVTGLKVVG
jgi:hypothetical protein